MENNTKEKKTSAINIIAVLLAFLIGLTVGNIDTDSLRLAASNRSTSGSRLITEETADKKSQEITEKETDTVSAYATPTTTREFSFTVYITPTGERYHLSPDCAGVNRIECSLEDAAAAGLTPCKRCADG